MGWDSVVVVVVVVVDVAVAASKRSLMRPAWSALKCIA